MAFNVLEHIEDPSEVVEEIYAGLSDGGVLIGSVPLNFSVLGSLATAISNVMDRTHVSTYPPDYWRSRFQEAGFEEVNFFGELNFGRNRCIYIKNPMWSHLSFNLMFVCKK